MVTDSLDTNILVRYITNDIPEKRQKAIKLLDSGDTHRLSDLALAEIVSVLEYHYGFSRREITDQLLFLLTHYDGTIIYNRALTSEAFPFYLKHPKLSFYDCCLATYAKIEDSKPLFTFDKKLATQHPSAKELK